MATQGQRRREAIAAVRKQRQVYRQADTAGERVERELDRLIKRKTLITVDELQKLANEIDAWLNLVTSVQKAFVILTQVITNIPH